MEALELLNILFDSVLALTLLWLAWSALSCTDLFKAIVLFIAFGLLLALVWVRLEAPDVALAEAAIGSGLTGALLLAAFRKLPASTNTDSIAEKNTSPVQIQQYLPAIVSLLTAIGLAYSIIILSPNTRGLNLEVMQHLKDSGVENPVTAVLLNFRGYDTLLEMVVLLIALLGVWSLNDASQQSEHAPGLLLDSFMRMLTPLLILTAGYLLWVGAHAPGGAFQAGAVLSAAGVLLLLSGRHPQRYLSSLTLRIMLLAGPAMFLIVAIASTLIKGTLLEFSPAHAGSIILLLESIATLSIAVTLAALFLGGHPGSQPDSHPQNEKSL